MRAGEIQPKKLVVFDIDDTLVHTQTKVHVIKDGEVIDSLNSHDFTHYKLKPGEEFDFSGFRNAREFFEKSKPIIPMMNQLKKDIATGNKVVMVTARADFDDRELFLDTFRKYGVDIDKVHVYRAGNSKQGTTEERKKAIIKNLLDKDDYSKAIMYDDAKPNLHTFMELKRDHPQTRFYAWHVSLEGQASEYMREASLDERKKKRRKKVRWAAWGPGPYGMYGTNTGYSGDGGAASGGAVGEDRDLTELNVAATLKFIKDAHGSQLYGNLPYWHHPRAVAMTGRKIFGSKFNSDAVKAAFLHDVVEDTNISLEELTKLDFDPKVIEAVSLLTKDRSLSYFQNIDRIIGSGNEIAQMVKYADNYENYTGDKSEWSADRAAKSNEKYLKSLNRLGDHLGVSHHIEEGWRDTLAGLALGAGVAMGSPADAKTNVEKVVVSPGQTVYSIARAFGTTPEVIQQLNKLDKNFTIKPDQVIKVPKLDFTNTDRMPTASKQPVASKQPAAKKDQKKVDTSRTMTGTRHEAILTAEARRAGITNPVELAAFLAQMAHETNDFKSLVEYGGSLDFRKYDIKFNPRKARQLGNTQVGDGARYKGRGYIQLTGRYNYKRAGEALGLPLEAKPELVERPDVAAKVAVWFWQQRVQPRVDNFNDVRAVTKPINPGLAGLQSRKDSFADFKAFKMASR
jgi:predicted chitinase/FMN phosphatase YigB (HAD superfamily)